VDCRADLDAMVNILPLLGIEPRSSRLPDTLRRGAGLKLKLMILLYIFFIGAYCNVDVILIVSGFCFMPRHTYRPKEFFIACLHTLPLPPFGSSDLRSFCVCL
jgi:hypothetical protein